MISFAGIDGIKMLSNLGGFPALILAIMVVISVIKVALNPGKYDLYEIDNNLICKRES